MGLIKQRTMNKQINYGIPSGFAKIDRAIYGWRNSDLIVIASRPSIGKTSFAMSIINNLSVEGVNTVNGVERIPCALFSLEMYKESWTKRFLFSVARIDEKDYEAKKLSDNISKIDVAMKKIMDAPIYIVDYPDNTLDEIRESARQLVSKEGVRIIIIDDLQMMTDDSIKYATREEELNTIVKSIKSLAEELNVPIIVMVRLNRNVDDVEDKENNNFMEALRHIKVGVIEQIADVLAFIHRPAYYHREEIFKGETDFTITKCSDYAEKKLILRFHEDYSLFSDTEEQFLNNK